MKHKADVKKEADEAGLMFRFATVERAAMKTAGGKRSLKVCFSSETPVLRSEGGKKYYEVLSHDPKDADISLLQDNGAFIDEHDWARQIGSVESASIDSDRKGRAKLSFANTDLANDRWDLMSGGHRKDISFGYVHTKLLSETFGDDGIPTRRFAWKAYEITSTAVGADHFETGVGRNHEIKILARKNLMIENTQNEITTIATAIANSQPHLKNEIKNAESRALLNDTPLTDFKRSLQELIQKNPAPPNTMIRVLDHEIGMSAREIKEFSFSRMFRSMVENNGKIKDCPEADISRQVEIQTKTSSAGCMIPSDVVFGRSRREFMKRDMTAGNYDSGGAAVGLQMLPPIDLLRNRTICTRLGATVLAGLQGNVVIPREISPVTPQSVPEAGLLNLSDLGLDQIHLTPHRLGVTVQFSRQLVIQSTPDIEAMIQNDCFQQMGIAHDELLLNGTGEQDEPLGVMNYVGIGSIVFGGSATFAKLVQFETAVAKMNADFGRLAYATTPNTKGIWKSTAVALQGASTVSSRALWENGNWGDGSNDGLVNSLRAASTNQIAFDRCIFGNWADLIYAQWGGYEAIYDPYTKAQSGGIVFTVNTWLDSALRHAQSFIVSADSAAQ